MTSERLEHGLRKALECWTLQNLCDAAIVLSFIALGLLAGRAYLEKYRLRLSLRVAVEAWDTVVELLTDGILLTILLVGVLVTNMDIMADIKIALPWVPLGFVLAGVALVLRLCHGGRRVGSKAWWGALTAMGIGCAAQWFGFTFVMESAGDEYLALHPAARGTWTALTNMRSNMNPDLSMATFRIAAPALALIIVWAVVVGVIQSLRTTPSEAPAGPAHEEADDDA